MKAILIGRHTGDEIPGVAIIEQRAITWGATAAEVMAEFRASYIMYDAWEGDYAVIFQNVPGQVAAALFHWIGDPHNARPEIGIVISKPGPRPAGVSKAFLTNDAKTLIEAVRLANPNVHIASSQEEGEWDAVRIEVDPPMKFEFSHIEWL